MCIWSMLISLFSYCKSQAFTLNTLRGFCNIYAQSTFFFLASLYFHFVIKFLLLLSICSLHFWCPLNLKMLPTPLLCLYYMGFTNPKLYLPPVKEQDKPMYVCNYQTEDAEFTSPRKKRSETQRSLFGDCQCMYRCVYTVRFRPRVLILVTADKAASIKYGIRCC